ncbi:Major Facilitator Superfamily protein [Nonomuraea solani]|uniref:Major Facilitator Superfamily protein n=1 Tax=Nonomuraea solani TaxID=1144553 RepID=A0A1H5VFD7_9ACTN|nr:MFS transporter [Nonomuraea solani]SEF85920.1 Major Facilitator Superfamily protein [Nonomuraea solani]
MVDQQGLDTTGQQKRRQLVRAVIASAVGTSIEWYDFFLYGFAASTIFAELFFPTEDPTTGLLLALGTYFGGFAARPIGAAIFGHYGDRIGRKATLIITLLTMGVATALVGLVPTYDQIGIWGGILLTLLRLLQGISVGGEWGGSVLLATEWGKSRGGKRGFLGSWPQFGVPVGLVLGYLALQVFQPLDPYWGWRIPFLLSIVMAGVGLYIRLGILETPVFEKVVRENKVERVPVRQVLAKNWREIVLSALLRTGQQAPFYIFTVFILSYATKTLGFEPSQVYTYVIVAGVISLFTVPFWGYMSDLVGRRRLYIVGAALMVVWSFIYWPLLDTRTPALVFLAIVLSAPIHDIQYGPQATFIAESFTGRLRYSGASLGYQLASVTAGGPAPLIAVWLLATYQSSFAIAVYMAICGLISVAAAWALKDRSHQDYAIEYDEDPAKSG